MRGEDDEQLLPPGTLPAAVGALGALAAAVLVCGLLFGWLLGSCDRPAPVQMIPAAHSTATASAQVSGIQHIRVTIPQNAQKPTLDVAPQGARTRSRGQSILLAGPSPEPSVSPGNRPSVESSNGADYGPMVIEIEQVLSASATASAEASASVAANYLQPVESSHGRLGIIAATMPGILAADLEIARLDVPPWLVGVPLEVGADVAGNLEAGAVGATVGGKGYVGGYAWSRWNLSAQGLAAAIGLRF